MINGAWLSTCHAYGLRSKSTANIQHRNPVVKYFNNYFFYIFFTKSHNVHRFTDSRVHGGVGVIGALRLIGLIGALRLMGLIGALRLMGLMGALRLMGLMGALRLIGLIGLMGALRLIGSMRRGYHSPIFPILPILPIVPQSSSFPLHFPKILLSLSAIIYVRANN